MWQHTYGVCVWRSVWKCKLDVCYHIAIMDLYIFSNIKLSDFNEVTTSSLRMIWIQIETCWSVLNVFNYFNINGID